MVSSLLRGIGFFFLHKYAVSPLPSFPSFPVCSFFSFPFLGSNTQQTHHLHLLSPIMTCDWKWISKQSTTYHLYIVANESIGGVFPITQLWVCYWEFTGRSERPHRDGRQWAGQKTREKKRKWERIEQRNKFCPILPLQNWEITLKVQTRAGGGILKTTKLSFRLWIRVSDHAATENLQGSR